MRLHVAMALAIGLASQVDVAAGSQYSLRSRYVAGAEGVPINVVESGPGDAPTVVLLHGFAQSHFSWMFQLESSLAESYHLVAPDLRGHGNSGKPWTEASYTAPCIWAEDIRRVIAATTRGPVVFVAWSFGTWVAVDYVTCFGTRDVSGVVMVGGLGGLVAPAAPTGAREQREAVARESRKLSGILSENFDAGEETERLLTYGTVPDIWKSRAAAVNVLLPPYARALALKRSFDHSRDLDRLNLPVLLVAGDHDPVAPASQAVALAARLPQATSRIIAGAGHSTMAEQPAAFNAMLLEFLAGTAQQPR